MNGAVPGQKKSLRLSVKALVAFGESSGDINFRFSSRSTALAGIRGHQRLQARRGEDYRAERAVTDVVSNGTIELNVSGRVDGYFPGTDPLVVEEIKTCRGEASLIPESVRRIHRGQARVYATLLGRTEAASRVTVRVTYLQLDDDSEWQDEETLPVAELEAWYADLVARYLAFEVRLQAWRNRRDTSIEVLTAPYDGFREGQREVAVSTWRALKTGSQAIIQAPTGIGKTMATIFPAVKAMRDMNYDKVFFMTAKGSGQRAAQSAIDDLRGAGLRLRDITLTARDKTCFNPGSPCHPDHCEFARGYFDRAAAVFAQEASSDEPLSRERIESLARANTLCPFELSLDLTSIADLIIGDYNYVYDPSVYLRRLFDDRPGRYALLVDEAHNLVDRGRDMLSAAISKGDVLRIRRDIKDSSRLVARRLGRVNAAILSLKKAHDLTSPSRETGGVAVLEELPSSLLTPLRRFCEAAEERLAEDAHPGLLSLYFDIHRFLRVAEWVDDSYRCLLETQDGETRVRIVNLNPAVGLAPGFARHAASVCFSGTLQPARYFRPLIGVDAEASWYRVASPFPQDNLGVFVAPFVSTAYRDRTASLDALVDVVASVVAGAGGNYLAYFPSHRYLADAADRFSERYPDIRTLKQARGGTEADRDAFLAAFENTGESAGESAGENTGENTGEGTLVGFAVMGGVFGEGVDLRGAGLKGVIIAGVGLPGISSERDLMLDYFGDESRDAGFRFAYQYPGINRVLQTAGRVIRSETDRGIVCLVDRRFVEPRYAELLPEEWQVQVTESCASLGESVRAFWSAAPHAAVRTGTGDAVSSSCRSDSQSITVSSPETDSVSAVQCSTQSPVFR